jgi:NAD(P)-dependent dehydrogenase (short-subunit alcohol dehydrogenase family)
VIEGMDRFEGYTALVTGAARGIGAASARRLAAEGARVLVADVDEETARETADALPGARAVRCDVGDPASVEAAVAYAAEAFGGLDVLVNNAFARDLPDEDAFEDEREDGWRTQLDVTLMGAVRCARAALPLLAAGGPGRSSTSAPSTPRRTSAVTPTAPPRPASPH